MFPEAEQRVHQWLRHKSWRTMGDKQVTGLLLEDTPQSPQWRPLEAGLGLGLGGW